MGVKLKKTYRKYNNVKTNIFGITFDSKKEANRYTELRMLLSAGVIKDLEIQPRIQLMVNDKSVGYYIGDFRYYDIEKAQLVLEDVKSTATKTPVYKLKKRILEAQIPPISIVEV
jgi:hypothetical protein